MKQGRVINSSSFSWNPNSTVETGSENTRKHSQNRVTLFMGGGTGGYRGYMYPPPFLEGGYKSCSGASVVAGSPARTTYLSIPSKHKLDYR